MAKIVRTDREIDDVLNQAADGRENGSQFTGMSYEEGVDAMYNWLVGDTDEKPME